MTTKIDKKGHWLDTHAAASYKRMVKAGMPDNVTSAGRTYAEQAALRKLYLAGKGAYALPAGKSVHEKGRAIDASKTQQAYLVRKGAENGWHRTNADEAWHYEYVRASDKHRPVLRVGSKGAEVKELQRKLGVKADGVFGPVTRNVVAKFQSKAKLVVDGVAGLQTRTALSM